MRVFTYRHLATFSERIAKQPHSAFNAVSATDLCILLKVVPNARFTPSLLGLIGQARQNCNSLAGRAEISDGRYEVGQVDVMLL